MSYRPLSERGSSFQALRRLARETPVREQCGLCSRRIPPAHRHLLETASRRIVCACDPCALRFQDVVGGRFKLVPRDARSLAGFEMSDADWDRLALPINLAFFYQDSASGKVAAMYPSPAGAMESLLALSCWKELAAAHPVLDQMQPDVEALLVNRVGAAREYFLVPIDLCYELVGLIRTHWRGLSGGETVWAEVRKFFEELARRAEPAAAVGEMAHA